MNKTINVAALRESIQNITKILSDRGIKVTQRGSKAYVESTLSGVPLRVNLPFIPETANQALIDAINGFLDHEVGHLIFSDFNVIADANRQGKAIAELHNIVEDAFIERKMTERFRGSAANLENVGKFFLEKYTDAQVEKAVETGDQNLAVSALMVPAIRAWAGQQVFEDYMSDKWELIEPITSVVTESMREAIANVTHSGEALTVAKSIHKAIVKPSDDDDEGEKPESTPKSSGKGGGEQPGESGKPTPKKKEKEPEPEEDESEDEEPESGKDEDEESEPESEDEEPESEDEEPESEDEEPTSSENEDDEDDPSESEHDDSEETAGDPSEEGEGEGEDSDPDEEDSEEESPGKGTMDSADLDRALKGSDFDDAVADAITSDSVSAFGDSNYNIYTDEFDYIGPFKLDNNYKDSYLEDVENQTKKMVGPLQKNLERLIVARKQSRWNSGQRRGRVNASSLYRLKTGDDRVFRKREVQGETKDVAISLVCDNSGSMHGAEIQIAMVSAFAMSTVLDRINVAHEVSGFTTTYGGSYSSEISKEESKLGISFSRTEPLFLPIYKAFHERLGTEQKKRIAYAPHKSFLRNNIDGESIAVAANRLLKRQEHGKIMFVLSDGQPAGYGNSRQQRRHLKDTVAKYSKLGVKMVGIGIRSSAVSSYYPDHIVLNDVADLPNQVMAQLRKVMLG